MACISVKGQVTIPIAIRKMLGLKEGDKVVFAEKADNIVLFNSNILAFEEFQSDMIGEAERVGWTSEQDVVEYCKKCGANYGRRSMRVMLESNMPYDTENKHHKINTFKAADKRDSTTKH